MGASAAQTEEETKISTRRRSPGLNEDCGDLHNPDQNKVEHGGQKKYHPASWPYQVATCSANKDNPGLIRN